MDADGAAARPRHLRGVREALAGARRRVRGQVQRHAQVRRLLDAQRPGVEQLDACSAATSPTRSPKLQEQATAATSSSTAARGSSQALLEQGLVDELRLMVFPVVLGSGKRLLNDGAAPTGCARSSRGRSGRDGRALRPPYEPPRCTSAVPPARHLLRAKDLVDARYREPLDVPALARAAHLSPAHFSREFRRAFGETPHQYLLTRRLERAAALLRNTDRAVADICLAVGLRSVGSFTTSFGRAYGLSPTAYRAAHPPAAVRARIPTCVQLAWARPQSSSFREDSRERAWLTSPPSIRDAREEDDVEAAHQRATSGSTTRTRRSPSTPRSSGWSSART